MKRDRPSLLVTALAFASLLIAALTARPEPHAAPNESGSGKPTSAMRPAGDGPGHDAGTPSEIPARGWWSIAKRVAGNVSEDRLMTEAAAITFYSLLALFPALAALVSIYGLFADPAALSSSLSADSGIMPGGGTQIITDQVHSLAANGSKALGLGAVLGLVTSLWSANQGTKALFDALNVVYHEKEKRGFLLRTAVTLAFTLGGILFVLVAMAAVVVLPIVLGFLLVMANDKRILGSRVNSPLGNVVAVGVGIICVGLGVWMGVLTLLGQAG